MNDQVTQHLNDLLAQWKKMQSADILEDAEDSATLFEYKFYQFIEVFRKWFCSIEPMTNLDQALAHPDIEKIVEQLPPPLYLPFENELDLMVSGDSQENDEKYD